MCLLILTSCRIRHVKCDEVKPACKKCTSSGRLCEGYADPFRSSVQFVLYSQTPKASRSMLNNRTNPSPESDLQISSGPATGLPSDPQDRHYLHHFRHYAVQDFSGLIDDDLWNTYVMRVSESTPTVKHGILALSAQHETFLKHGHTKDLGTALGGDTANAYARAQYSKTIRSLYYRLDKTPGDINTTEEALVTCLLLIVFEVLQGNFGAALLHLEGGLKMLSTLDQSVNRKSTSELVDHSGRTSPLAKMFTRLDILASTYIGVRKVESFFAPTYKISTQQLSPHALIKSELMFHTIGDARDALNTQIANIFNFLRSPSLSLKDVPELRSQPVMELKYNPYVHSTGAEASLFDDVIQERQLYLSSLGRWMLAFEAFLEPHSNKNTSQSRKDKAAQQCGAVWLSYLATLITLSTSLEPDECSYDKFLPQFQSIVEHAGSILHPRSGLDKFHAGRRRFTLEMSVIHPLYITALKCRDFTVRHRAITLLEISGQEGVWNGKMIGTIAKYIASHEEEQGYVDVYPEQFANLKSNFKADNITRMISNWSRAENFVIPESARIHGVSLDLYDPGSGSVWIDSSKRKFIRRGGGEGEDSTKWEEGCEWDFHKKYLEW